MCKGTGKNHQWLNEKQLREYKPEVIYTHTHTHTGTEGKYHNWLNGESIKIVKQNKIKMKTLEPKCRITKMKNYLIGLSEIRESKRNWY